MEYQGTNQEFKLLLESMNRFTVETATEDGEPIKLRKIPGKLAYAFRKNRRALTPVVEDFEEERKSTAIAFCKIGEDGKPRTKKVGKQEIFDLENPEGFNEAFSKLALTKETVTLHLVPDSVIEEMETVDEEALGWIAWIFEGELEQLVKARKEAEEQAKAEPVNESA